MCVLCFQWLDPVLGRSLLLPFPFLVLPCLVLPREARCLGVPLEISQRGASDVGPQTQMVSFCSRSMVEVKARGEGEATPSLFLATRSNPPEPRALAPLAGPCWRRGRSRKLFPLARSHHLWSLHCVLMWRRVPVRIARHVAVGRHVDSFGRG